MEERRVRGVVVVFVVLLGLLSSQVVSGLSFSDCYRIQFFGCVMKPKTSVFKCAFKSLEMCIIQSIGNAKSTLSGSDQHCMVECAKSKCTHLSTRRDPGGWKVERCVDSCSKECQINT